MNKEIIKSRVSKSEFAKICDLIKDWDDLTLAIIEDNIMGLEDNIQKLESDLEIIKDGINLELHYIEKARRVQVEHIHKLEDDIKKMRIEMRHIDEKNRYLEKLEQMSDDLEIQKQKYILCFDEVENCQSRSIKYENQINGGIKEIQIKILVFHKIRDTFIELWPESPRQPTSPRSKLAASPLRRPRSFKNFLKTSPAFKSFPSGSVSLPASPRRQNEKDKSKSKNKLRRKCYSPLNTPVNSPIIEKK